MLESDLVSLLSDWSSVTDPLAPISPQQQDLITDFGEVVKERPLPPHLRVKSNGGQSQYEASSTASVRSGGLQDFEEQASDGLFPAFFKLEVGSAKIDTGQQFLQWIHQVDESLTAQQDVPFKRYINELERQVEVTTNLEKEVEGSLSLLESLTEQYLAVSERTTSLHEACQHLLEDQTKLAEIDSDLQSRLAVFHQADKVAHKLCSATFSVHSDSFFPLLTQIDSAILYLCQHSHYTEAATYLTKFRASLSRALEMVRSYVRRVLEGATGAASSQTRQLQEGEISPAGPHSAFTLFYGKFRAIAPKLRPIIQEMEGRGGLTGDEGPVKGVGEYVRLVQDLQQFYLECRMGLLHNSVKGAVQQLLTVHTRDHTGLVRAGCAFLLHVCEDESQLHAQFFGQHSEDESQLEAFLEKLCLILYDSLRPLIIQVSHLETLAELTAILRNEVVGQHCINHPQLGGFRTVVGQMLQDVQERLVYRTSVYIRTDIQGYSPSPGDLAYPQKLEMMEEIAGQLRQQQQQERERRSHSRQNSSSSVVSVTSMEVNNINSQAGVTSHASNSPADLHGMWYPPVRRSLTTLSKLYRCLERNIFTGLSQEVLTACLGSVASAAESISSNPKKKPEDGQLFQIKHLLILREQIAPFQVDFTVKETSLDFGKIKDSAMKLLNHRSEILSMGSNNALLEFLLDSSPGVQEHLRDSKKEVDRQLKLTCEQFISSISSRMLELVTNFNTLAAQILISRKEKVSLPSQPWGAPDRLREVVVETLRRVKEQVPLIQRKMQLYLSNRETEFILFRPVRSNILSAFVTLLSTLRAQYSLDQQTVVGCPSQEQLAATLASVMVVHVGGSLSRHSSVSVSVSRQISASPEPVRKESVSGKSVKFSPDTSGEDLGNENKENISGNAENSANPTEHVNGNGVEAINS